MKLLVVSDSHGDHQILQDLLNRYTGKVQGFIHCGDSELTADQPLSQQFWLVRGNMDFEPAFPLNLTKTKGAETIFITHGHLLGVNLNLDRLEAAAAEKQATVACYGHTHQLLCQMNAAGCLIINPGSISQPRGKWAYLGGTYALIELGEAKVKVQYYNRDHQAIDQLAYQFPRH